MFSLWHWRKLNDNEMKKMERRRGNDRLKKYYVGFEYCFPFELTASTIVVNMSLIAVKGDDWLCKVVILIDIIGTYLLWNLPRT